MIWDQCISPDPYLIAEEQAAPDFVRPTWNFDFQRSTTYEIENANLGRFFRSIFLYKISLAAKTGYIFWELSFVSVCVLVLVLKHNHIKASYCRAFQHCTINVFQAFVRV